MIRKTFTRIANPLRNLGSKPMALAVGGAAAAGVAPAFAAVTFDTTDILAGFAVMVAAGGIIYAAYAAGKWALRAFSLIGGK